MGNALLSFEDFVGASGSEILASSEAGALSVANLVESAIQQVWRALTATAYVEVDFGAVKEVGVVALAVPHHSSVLSGRSDIRLRLDRETAAAGAVLDLAQGDAIDREHGYWLRHFDPPLAARYLRLDLSAEATGYVELGRLWAGSAICPGVNFSYGWSRRWSDEGRSTKVPHSGLRMREAGPRRRRITLTFDALSVAEAEAVLMADKLVGRTGQLLFSSDPEDGGRSSFFCTAEDVLPITQPFADVFAKSYQLEEDL